MNYSIYKFLFELSDFEEELFLSEQNINNIYISRVYSISYLADEIFCGVYNTYNENGVNKIGRKGHGEEWEEIAFNRFIEMRKSMASQFQERFEEILEMTKTENFICYEGSNYVIYIPRYSIKIIGPKKNYEFSRNSNNDVDQYFFNILDNTSDNSEKNSSEYIQVPNSNLNQFIEKWSSFIDLITAESKYF